MRKRAICALAVTVAVGTLGAAVAVAGSEKPIVVRAGNVILTVNGNTSPKALPSHGLAPISFHASGKIATADGTHPPALRETVLDTGKVAVIEADRFPACTLGELEATTTREAERKCGDAIVGRGRVEGEVAFPESIPFPANGPLVLFNGGRKGGKYLLYIHAYVAVPAPTAVIARSVTTRIHRGEYRLHSVTTTPVVAGGAGSVLGFRLEINRRGYLKANCDNGHFSAYINAKFADKTTIAGSFQRPCTPID
jgi:hypothetical protein